MVRVRLASESRLGWECWTLFRHTNTHKIKQHQKTHRSGYAADSGGNSVPINRIWVEWWWSDLKDFFFPSISEFHNQKIIIKSFYFIASQVEAAFKSSWEQRKKEDGQEVKVPAVLNPQCTVVKSILSEKITQKRENNTKRQQLLDFVSPKTTKTPSVNHLPQQIFPESLRGRCRPSTVQQINK